MDICFVDGCTFYAKQSGLCFEHFRNLVRGMLLLGPMCVEKDCPNLQELNHKLCSKHISIYNMRSYKNAEFSATKEIAKQCMREILDQELKISIQRVATSLLERIGDEVQILLLTTCECCFETAFEHNQLILCPNNHAFCVDCIQRYTETMINTSKVSLKCMSCDECFRDDDLRMCVQVDTYLKFSILLHIKEIAKISTIVDDFQICPFCASYGCVFEENPTCQLCEKSWCLNCRTKLHVGECFVTVDNVDRMIQEIFSNSLVHKCPNCKTKHHREDGCNHISCPVCNTDSCYICGKDISGPDVYLHFHSGPCDSKMYAKAATNTTFLIKELTEFINKNRENSTLIYERLKINCDSSDQILINKIKSLRSICNIKNTSDDYACCIT